MARTATTISWPGCGHGCGCIDIPHSILRPGRGSRPQHDPSILRLEKINGREQGRASSACRRISQQGQYGVQNIIVMHHLGDLKAAGDAGSRTAELAQNLLADAATRVLYHLD